MPEIMATSTVIPHLGTMFQHMECVKQHEMLFFFSSYSNHRVPLYDEWFISCCFFLEVKWKDSSQQHSWFVSYRKKKTVGRFLFFLNYKYWIILRKVFKKSSTGCSTLESANLYFRIFFKSTDWTELKYDFRSRLKFCRFFFCELSIPLPGTF